MIDLRKADWATTQLREVCAKVEKIKSQENLEGDFSYIDIGSINSELNEITEAKKIAWEDASSRARQIVKTNDTLFSTVRVNLKRIAIIKNGYDENIASTGFCVLRANKDFIDPIFLFYSVLTPIFLGRLIDLQKGTAYPAVTDRTVKEQEILLPPLPEQKRIAALFQSIDQAIEQTEAQERNLRQTKKKLLQDLFGEELQFGNYLTSEDYEIVDFRKVAELISQRVEPAETDLEIYVGLEHLDSENLRIERNGTPADVKGTKFKVYKGDIMFGKRRAYLRKVAVSHFNGICSAHSMVLRAQEENIDKEFLPYLMQSDYFMDRAVQISEGSLSPTIKWKVLARQEFHIPKKEKQKKLVDLFAHFDNLIYGLRDSQSNLKKLKHKLLDEILG